MRTLAPTLAALAAAALPAAALAQAPLDTQALRDYVARQVAATGGVSRFEVQVGPAEARAGLAPCRRTEPFVPAGARLWGRAALGLRCAEGAGWTVMVPVHVAAWGPALVATRLLAAGSPVGPSDVAEQEVELTRESPGALRDVAQLEGRVLTRPVHPGQWLRADLLRLPPAVQAGEPVRLRIQGSGFIVTAAGQALAAAAAGQPVRVRTEFGRILSGIAREGRVVEVTL